MANDVNLLEKLEDAIKAGNLVLVHDALNQLKPGEIPANEVVRYANIARRAGYHRMAIRLLYPIVRNKSKSGKSPSNLEKAEYAMALSRAGALAEAHALLDEIPANFPERLLYKAFSHFASWDYHLAIPLLKKYLEDESISHYQKTVAAINLADAYFTEGLYSEAQVLCNRLLEKLDSQKQKLNAGYLQQILGQIAVMEKDFEAATNHFSRVEELVGENHYRYYLYLRKWRAILQCLKKHTEPSSENLLIEVREEARRKNVWEVVREMDFYRAIIFSQRNLFWQVYFSTPYPHYRERMLKISGYAEVPPTTYDIPFNSDRGTPTQIFNIPGGCDESKDISLKKGQLVHRLLVILASDFYRPFRVETLFSLLFPDELYNIKKSSYKVHDTMSRLRAWFLENGLPFSIDEDDSQYRLRVSEPHILRVQVAKSADSNIDAFVAELKMYFPHTPFKIQDVINLKSHPRSTAKWLLTRAVSEGLLDRVGQGRGVKYKLAG